MRPTPERKTAASREPELLDPAPRDAHFTWGLGVAGALALAVYGLGCILSRSATWVGGTDLDLALGGGPEIHCRGPSAVAVGVFWMALAGFLHVHFFWSWRERFFGYAQIGKLLSLVIGTGAILYFIYREGVTGW